MPEGEGVYHVVTDAPSTVTAREVREDDLAMLLFHRNQWNTRRFLEDCRQIDHEQQKAWFAHGGAANLRIVESEGVAVGLMRYRVDGEEAEVGCDVFEKYRGQGFGKETIKLALHMAKMRGCKRATLWVFLQNIPACAIYAQFGFTVDMMTPIKVFIRGEPIQYVRMFAAL